MERSKTSVAACESCEKFFGITVFCNCLHRQDVISSHHAAENGPSSLALFELLVVFHLKVVLLFVELDFEFFQLIFPRAST